MAYLGDYHTHTKYSHGKGTVEENVIEAIKKGLREIAITDHGFGHRAFNVKRREWDKLKNEVVALREKYPQIKIMLGIEANLTSSKGDIDLTEEEFSEMDIVVCGFHKAAKAATCKELYRFVFPNMFEVKNKKMFVRNTDAYLKLIERYKVDIISHMNYSIYADAVEVSKACKHFGTYVELNGKRICFTDAELEKIIQEGVNFICSSDAHSVERVADMTLPEKIIEKFGIPREQIVNWDRVPLFRSKA